MSEQKTILPALAIARRRCDRRRRRRRRGCGGGESCEQRCDDRERRGTSWCISFRLGCGRAAPVLLLRLGKEPGRRSNVLEHLPLGALRIAGGDHGDDPPMRGLRQSPARLALRRPAPGRVERVHEPLDQSRRGGCCGSPGRSPGGTGRPVRFAARHRLRQLRRRSASPRISSMSASVARSAARAAIPGSTASRRSSSSVVSRSLRSTPETIGPVKSECEREPERACRSPAAV